MRHMMKWVCTLAVIGSVQGAMAQKKTTRKATPSAPAAAPAAEAPVASEPAHPRKSLHDQVSGQGYGLAGCGLGSIVFGPKPGMIQIVAAWLNATGYQTFAITTGTSNCDIPEAGHQAAVFIEVNKETVTKEAARGTGETIDGLAEIFQCRDSHLLGESIKAHYNEIFGGSNSTYESTRQIIKTINSDSSLKSSCEQIG